MPLTEEQKRMLLEKIRSRQIQAPNSATEEQSALTPQNAAPFAGRQPMPSALTNPNSPESRQLRARLGQTASADAITPGQEMAPPGQTLLPERQLLPGQAGAISPQQAPLTPTPEELLGPRGTDQQWALPPEQQMAGVEDEEERKRKARALVLQELARGQAGEGQQITSGESPILES